VTLGRHSEPDQVAAMLLFLCSELAGFVNGSNMLINSGLLMTARPLSDAF
jgi:enoyl-[acyl-carrier-protein] reductase (NADH)